nr:uncharacterized protein LOC106614134 [Bactrocera oleae]
MSEDISNTTNIFNTKLTKQGTVHSEKGKLLRFEEINIPIGQTSGIKPSPTATGKNAWISKAHITTNACLSKSRLTNKEYMTTQKVYDVLKEPDDYSPFGCALSLKPNNMKCTNKSVLLNFPPLLNIPIKKQLATNSNEAALRSKPKVAVKISNEDASPAAPKTASVDDTTTTSPTIMRPTAAVSITKPTGLTESLMISVVKPLEVDRDTVQTPTTSATIMRPTAAVSLTKPTELNESLMISVVKPLEIDRDTEQTPTTSPTIMKPTATVSITKPTELTESLIKPMEIDRAAAETPTIMRPTAAVSITKPTELNESLMISVVKPLEIDRDTVQTPTTSPTIMKPTAAVFITKPTELNESLMISVVKPMEIDRDVAQTPETTATTSEITSGMFSAATITTAEIENLKSITTKTTVTEIESSSCNTTSKASMEKLAAEKNEKATTKIIPILAPSAYTTKSLAVNNIMEKAKSNKKSVMRSVHIPLSIASQAHKSLAIKATKTPIHPLSKSRNCVLFTNKSNTTTKSNGIFKFIPKNPWPMKYIPDKRDDSNTNDSNSNDTLSSKESENVTTKGKEVLVITTDINTNKTAVNIPVVPLVGKRKYTDPATMPILSFSYQKSLSEYIRKAKEFHKRAKMEKTEASAATDNSKSIEEQSVKNMISTDMDGANTKDGSGNNDNANMNGYDESNLTQGETTEERQNQLTAIMNEESKNVEPPKKEKGTGTTKDLDKQRDIEKIESLEKVKDMESTSLDNPKNLKSTEGTETITDVESTPSIDKLTNIELDQNTETLEIESSEGRDNVKEVESAEDTKKLKDIESAEGINNAMEVDLADDTKSVKNINSAEARNNTKDMESTVGIENLRDAESAEKTKDLNVMDAADGTINLKDIESAKFIDSLIDLETTESADNLKDVGSTGSSKDLKNIETTENTINLKDVELTERTENFTYMESTECADNRKNIATTADMGNQIDIESDLFTFEIFNNVSGISNTSTRNERTQTKDSTIKILKNIFELKEKVKQQAEEIISLKAAMKLLKTPNMLSRP